MKNNKEKEIEICHVCKKEKKPYIKFMDDNFISFMEHEQAREDGEICQRCDSYFAMTGELKEPTKEEFELADKACEFARNLKLWWEKDKKLDCGSGEDSYDWGDEEENKRAWQGTNSFRNWYLKEFDNEEDKK